jgi:hypothetical protein
VDVLQVELYSRCRLVGLHTWYWFFGSIFDMARSFLSFLCKSTVQFNSRFFSSAREVEYTNMCDCSEDRCLLCFASSEDRCVLCWLACIFSPFFSFLSKLQLCTGSRRYYTYLEKRKEKKRKCLLYNKDILPQSEKESKSHFMRSQWILSLTKFIENIIYA